MYIHTHTKVASNRLYIDLKHGKNEREQHTRQRQRALNDTNGGGNDDDNSNNRKKKQRSNFDANVTSAAAARVCCPLFTLKTLNSNRDADDKLVKLRQSMYNLFIYLFIFLFTIRFQSIHMMALSFLH